MHELMMKIKGICKMHPRKYPACMKMMKCMEEMKMEMPEAMKEFKMMVMEHPKTFPRAQEMMMKMEMWKEHMAMKRK